MTSEVFSVLPPSLWIFLALRLKYISLLVKEYQWGWGQQEEEEEKEAGAVACSRLIGRAEDLYRYVSDQLRPPLMLLLFTEHYFNTRQRRWCWRRRLQPASGRKNCEHTALPKVIFKIKVKSSFTKWDRVRIDRKHRAFPLLICTTV